MALSKPKIDPDHGPSEKQLKAMVSSELVSANKQLVEANNELSVELETEKKLHEDTMGQLELAKKEIDSLNAEIVKLKKSAEKGKGKK